MINWLTTIYGGTLSIENIIIGKESNSNPYEDIDETDVAPICTNDNIAILLLVELLIIYKIKVLLIARKRAN